MAQIKHIFIICGEASGDLYAANLTKAIKEINPDIKISGVGGALMLNAGAKIYCDIKNLAVIGFFDVIKKLPNFFSLKKLILEKIKEEKPDAIILIDFSGFNLRLAKKINKAIPTIYYISPQVWASRRGRIKTIKKYIHKLIVIFKFEEEFYKRFGIDAVFAGHPLLDIIQPSMDRKEFLTKFYLSESKTTIALLPGSRRQEIEKILPVMLDTSLLISKKLSHVQFIIVKSPQLGWDIYNQKIHGLDMDMIIIEGKTYDCLESADFCLVASGTAILETTIMQKPFVAIYRMGLLNYLFYRPQVKVPYIGIANIVAKRKVVPEFIQSQATAKNISDCVLKFLENPPEIERLKNDLAQVKSLLGEKGSTFRTARFIIDLLNKH